MKCSKCGRKAPPNKSKCLYCGGAIDLSFEDTNIKCPACSDEMTKRTVAGVVIDYCESCHGLWLDKDELETLAKKHVDPQLVQPSSEESKMPSLKLRAHEYRKCPRCDRLMQFKNYQSSGVMIDMCGYHGLFFDEGELSRAIKMVNNHSAVRANLDMLRKQQETSSSMKNTQPSSGFFRSIFDLFWG